MLWAIDVGNTHTVIGLNDGTWRAVWRIQTNPHLTEDELAGQLKGLCDLAGLRVAGDGFAIASVVPSFNDTLARFARKWLGVEPFFLRSGAQVGVDVRYSPPDAVGADRIANVLGALAIVKPPVIVVDFGSATTFDAIGPSGEYLGGAILPGVLISLEALFQKTAKLPQVELKEPPQAIGTTTPQAIQSGVVLGYAGAIDSLVERFTSELGKATVIATGGLGESFATICKRIERYEAMLTLEGICIAYSKTRQ